MNKLKLTTKDIIVIAMFAALTAVLSQIIIPLPFTPVPLSLATLSIFIAGGLLGATKGGMSQLIYVLLGAVGVPVFAGFSGGFGVITGPTGGYIFGYVAGAFVIGLLMLKLPKKVWGYGIAMIFGIVTCYVIGTAWFMRLMGRGLLESLGMCVFPYIPGDLLKIALAATLVKRLGGLV